MSETVKIAKLDPKKFGDVVAAAKEELTSTTDPVLTSITAADLLAKDIRNIPTLLDDFIIAVGIVILVGSSDAGKSMFTRFLAICFAAGLPSFVGFRFSPNLKRSVLVVCSEDDEFAISYLLSKQTSVLDPTELHQAKKNLRFVFDTDQLIEKLDAYLSMNDVGLIVIDTLGDIPNDIRDNSEMRNILSGFKKLATTYQCLILLMHHTNKKTEHMAPSKSNIMGAGGIEQKCRLALELRSDPNDENVKHLSVLKGNYLSKEFKGASFVLRFDPETFTFENTGDRIEFDQLVIRPEAEQKPKKVRLPDYAEIEPSTFRMIMEPMFEKKPEGFLRSELIGVLAPQFKVYFNLPENPGRDRVSDMITRLQMDGLLNTPVKSGRSAFITMNNEFEYNGTS